MTPTEVRALADKLTGIPFYFGLVVETLRSLADQVDALQKAEDALLRKGYKKSCDIPACNCGDQWTHGGHAEARLREFREVFEQADIDLNGKTLLTALCEVLGDRAREAI